MSENKKVYGMGWLPEYPDFRDFVPEHSEVKDMVSALKLTKPETKKIKPSIDLTKWCPPIEDQGSLGSCTANAGVGMIEYYERRAFGTHTDASRLFLYKVTRKLLNWTGDTGAFLRTTMGAMALFGAPPEKYWPYIIEDYEGEPTAFCYSFAENYKAIKYFRLDPQGTPKKELLRKIKTYLAAGMPSMFGFTVYTSIQQASNTGKIPYPSNVDKIDGGHAVMAVGYDDKMQITNSTDNNKTVGALKIRNSWGAGWGDGGYGWLPYEYVLQGLAIDWWTLLKAEYIPTKKFGF